MKRSEMIKAIKDALHPHLPQYDECPNFIAETVLNVVEGRHGQPCGGMLPPFNHMIFYKTWRDGGSGNEWEPECQGD